APGRRSRQRAAVEMVSPRQLAPAKSVARPAAVAKLDERAYRRRNYLTPASTPNGLRPGPSPKGQGLRGRRWLSPPELRSGKGRGRTPIWRSPPARLPPVFPLCGERLRAPRACLQPDLAVWRATT